MIFVYCLVFSIHFRLALFGLVNTNTK